MPFTITGIIQTEVWLEYSTDGGTTWTRLLNSFPSGGSIITNALPTNVDLKIRLVAVCDEDLISNVVDYDYIPPIETIFSGERSSGLSTEIGGCDAGILTNINCFFVLSDVSTLQNGDKVCNTNNSSDPFIGDITKYYKVVILDLSWTGINSSWLVKINSSGIVTIIDICE